MQSLREKLLKAGLITEDAAKKAEAQKAATPAPVDRPRSMERRNGSDRPRSMERRDGAQPRQEAPRIPKLPPLAGSKEAHRLMSKRQLEVDRAIREKVLANQVPPESGATTFYFVTRKNRLRRLELSAEQAKKLEAGELAVVERPDPDKIEHALVPPGVAEELLALSARSVRFLNRPGTQVGFLSEEEIHARAGEATGSEEPEANEADAEPSALGSAASAPGAKASSPAVSTPAEQPTYITIKRSPRG